MKRNSLSAFLLALLFCLSSLSCRAAVFTSEDWKRAGAAERQSMVDSLMRDYDLVGWTESEVIRLLGPETSADPDFRFSISEDTEDTLVYSLGEYGIGNLRLLVITLDGDRTVTKWELTDHSM